MISFIVNVKLDSLAEMGKFLSFPKRLLFPYSIFAITSLLSAVPMFILR
jgi:hypothetical protein